MIRTVVQIICCLFVYFSFTACDKLPCEPEIDRLKTVFVDDTFQLTGVAITPEERLFVNYPLWSDIYKYAVIEAGRENDKRHEETSWNRKHPYPNLYMNSWQAGQDGKDKWVCVQAVYADERNYLWVVDPASPKMAGVYQNSHKLVKINLATNNIERTYFFEGVAGPQSYINDVRVDNQRQYAYLTNSNEGGILVVNLASGNARQVLQEHYSTKSDPAFRFIIDGRELTKNGQPVKIHSDGIALTPDGDWLYYKPLTDDKLYRIRTEFLRNDTMSSAALGSKVEDLGHFATTDGMIFDKKGNLYIGDLQNYAIKRISPDLKMQTLIRDERLIWPDSYSISNDGYLYISCSQIHKQPEYNNGVNKRTTPYTVYKLKLP
ncbi:L-dopachrome tautomerase-related protein [Longitalea arenae]|uniref:L-dopachrome tautomerase-related protein n=1 Tax=Longitalea arenae TaxID=2812558 RepID=UPI00196863A9|nr:L-dopachrome tautomerase-related protein [Longitalea arenae]